MQVWDSARSEEDSPHADVRRQPNDFHHIVSPEICAPLTAAALEWLKNNEPLLEEISAAVEGLTALSHAQQMRIHACQFCCIPLYTVMLIWGAAKQYIHANLTITWVSEVSTQV